MLSTQNCTNNNSYKQQQDLFAIGGWKPEGHKTIRAGSKESWFQKTLVMVN